MLPLYACLISALCVAHAAPVSSSNTTTTNSTVQAVCSPTECVEGQNSLSAGVTVRTQVNGTTRSTVLLPGSYSVTAAASSDNTSDLVFDKTSTVQASTGFSGSGTITSTYSVSLANGLVAYSSPLYQGAASIQYPSYNASANGSTLSSLILSSNLWAVIQVDNARTVIWDSVADVGNLAGSSTGKAQLSMLQSSTCSTPCASGGYCAQNGTCVCNTGWTGTTCSMVFSPLRPACINNVRQDACAAGYYGPSCSACPAGCTCDDGITGSGKCIATTSTNGTAAACNCVNGQCASDASTASCTCQPGWARAANGTQCAACDTGFYSSASGDCLVCDPSCASCSGPTGQCTTCQSGLQPHSTDPTKCVAATHAVSNNGTFVTCPSKQYWDSASSSCLDCSPRCASCFAPGEAGCISCTSPNALLAGSCVAMDSSTGACDSTNSTSGGWIYDNAKAACDALPARCTAGSIANFGSSSTRSQLSCTACIQGTYLVNGACLSTCPAGTLPSTEGKTCTSCDSSCSSCSESTTFCTTCSDSSKLVLNGTCVTGPSCPTGWFLGSGNNSTQFQCLPCHPDCASCSTTFDTCTSCPPSRPVLSSQNTCLATCASNEYFDTAKASCQPCSTGCATCSGSSSSQCLSCPSSPPSKLVLGTCRSVDCTILPSFGVCLSDLVTVSARSASTTASNDSSKRALPWWSILLIIALVFGALSALLIMWRRREQKRRREQTERFRNNLGKREVELKLQDLAAASSEKSTHAAYPPSQESATERLDDQWEYTTKPFFPTSTASKVHFSASDAGQERRSPSPAASLQTTLTAASLRSASPFSIRDKNDSLSPLVPQTTGASIYSQATGKSIVSASGKTIQLSRRNPFNRYAS